MADRPIYWDSYSFSQNNFFQVEGIKGNTGRDPVPLRLRPNLELVRLPRPPPDELIGLLCKHESTVIRGVIGADTTTMHHLNSNPRPISVPVGQSRPRRAEEA